MTSPLVADIDVLTVEVRIDGTRLADAYEVLTVEVDRELNRIPTASVTIADGDLQEATFAASSADVFVPGAAVEVRAGYGTTTTSLFQGVITGQTIRLGPDGTGSLTVTCTDRAAALALTRMSRQYLDMADSDIMAELIGKAGLTADVAATTPSHPQLVQHDVSPWDFVLSRAEANGLVVMVDDGTVRVQPPQFEEPSVRLRLGDSIGELEADLDARTQLPSLTSVAWDPASQAMTTGDASEPTVNAQGDLDASALLKAFPLDDMQLPTQAAVPAPVLSTWANARLLRSRLARIRGTVAFPGSAAPRPGGTVRLEGVGTRFNGRAYVSSVRHRLEEGTWVTRVGFGLSPLPYVVATERIESPGAAGLLPAVRGLQIAQVLQVDQDPDAQRRIKVALPLMPNGGDGLWVRFLAPYATKNAGICFLPEVGDEVVVGFLGGDPTAAVVLGSLHSSERAAPLDPVDTNALKGIISNSQLKITFDDEKKILVLVTPGGHTIQLDDDQQQVTIKDSNGNEIAMTGSALTITAPGDLALKAQGSVTIEGQAGVTISSPADAAFKGLNVELAGQVGLKASGQAQAELSASGSVTVRGAMVMIN